MSLANWPPSRGENPHKHDVIFEPGRTAAKDLPAPPKREIAEVEKRVMAAVEAAPDVEAALTSMESGNPSAAGLPAPGVMKFERTPLAGRKWRMNYRVEDVAALTMEHAINVLGACQTDPKERHFDQWLGAEPRVLWVDIVYPLERGVRLEIGPMTKVWTGCTHHEKKIEEDRSDEMRLGYFLWTVAKEYERIYKEHEKYGVWGHALNDLFFERISIDADGVARLGIGS